MKLCNLPPVVVIAGPTATGKTEMGVRVAAALGGEVVSADARQVYRGMDIGTAKPTAEQRSSVRHHLLDIRDPDEQYSAGQFGHDARAAIAALRGEGRPPILVGGSGLYLEAVLDGLWEEMRDGRGVRGALQARLEAEGLPVLYEELRRLDPVAQTRLAAGDTQRILRALELALLTEPGQVGPWSGDRQESLEGLPVAFCLTRERAALYRRIDARVERMLGRGLVDEVAGLVGRGHGRHTPSMGTMGYAEIIAYLEGECSLERATDRIRQRSRQYAKRQLTWFRRDRRLRWLDVGEWGEDGVLERILGQVAARCR